MERYPTGLSTVLPYRVMDPTYSGLRKSLQFKKITEDPIVAFP